VGGFSAVLFAAHVNIATFAQNEERQTGKYGKSDCNFPHKNSLFNKSSPK